MHGQKYLYELLENYFQQMSVFDFEFVEEKKKDCFEIEYTVKNPISNTIYSGKFYLYKNRTLTDSEYYVATLLASFGFEVYMIDEPTSGGKKVDAIVNNVPVNFKSVGLGNNAIKTNYQNGMEKEHCKGIVMTIEKEILYRVKNQKKKIVEKTLSEAVKSYTKSQNNGFLSIWIEEIETFKNFDMKKIRESHNTKK